MLRGLHRCAVALLACCAAGCDGDDARRGPPPLPKLPDAPAVAPELVAPAPPPAPVRGRRAGQKRPPPPAARSVTVPRTAHVWAELPAGLQADLDADPRMQAWLDASIAVIDRCHAASRGAVGVIQGTLTMHENERPDLALTSMPAALGMVVACATGPLTKSRMPLFTGKEGRQYVVRLHFE